MSNQRCVLLTVHTLQESGTKPCCANTCLQSCPEQSLPGREHLCEQDLVKVALGPGRALKGVAPVHEGTLVHACAPPPLDWWQPVGTPLQRFAWSIQKA